MGKVMQRKNKLMRSKLFQAKNALFITRNQEENGAVEFFSKEVHHHA
jgi:hypothetical protein